MIRYCALLLLLVCPAGAVAEEVTVRFRVTGLFQPDRVEDLQAQATGVQSAALARIDYDNAVLEWTYDAAQPPLKDKPADQVRQILDQELRNVSKSTFTLKPLSTVPAEKLVKTRIPVEGLDCKACSFAAYNMIAELPGVERATASFKHGEVVAWIDPEQVTPETLIEALKKGGVTVVSDNAAPDDK